MAGIKDVAARAGVSISTVSYVVSGKRRIGAETQARVRAAALELGYRPVIDATEPAFARGTHVLAVVAHGLVHEVDVGAAAHRYQREKEDENSHASDPVREASPEQRRV